MFTAVLASLLAFAPPDVLTTSSGAPAEPASPGKPIVAEPEPAESEPQPTEPEPVRAPGTLVLAPSDAGEYQLLDASGQTIGQPLRAGEGQRHELELPAGIYSIRGPNGVSQIAVESGLAQAWDGERVLPLEDWEAELARQAELDQANAEAPAQARVEPPAPRPPHQWRAWASPLGSTFVPGLGQFLNGQGGKGTGLLFGTLGSVVGAAALYNLGNYPGAEGPRPIGAEYARLIGFGVLSTSAVLLWIYGIADAHRLGAKKKVEPLLGHRLRLSATRMMTVGFRADVRRPGFFDDWSVAIMGQATRRLTVGVSDLSVKPGGVVGPQVWQFGARLDYRVFDRKRVWIDLAVGSIFQVAVGQQRSAELSTDPISPKSQIKFGAIPYGQLDVRVFVLDRLSIDLVPRLAVPLTTRYYSVQRALPRFAPELELGAGVSTYF